MSSTEEPGPLAQQFASLRRCPVHGIPDCSPLLNGCSIPDKQAPFIDAIERHVQDMEKALREIRDLRLDENLELFPAANKARGEMRELARAALSAYTIIRPIQKRGGYQPTGPAHPVPPSGGGAK